MSMHILINRFKSFCESIYFSAELKMSRGNKTIFSVVFQNFMKSMRPRQQTGNLMGEDYFGNKYYEIPAKPQIGKRRAERWFEPSSNADENFDNELTAEWESWLRHRR